MSSRCGQKPPLHKRYSQEEALKHIANRYVTIHDIIPEQIDLLQKSYNFRGLCEDYYAKGYKDWVILSAVLNCMLNWKSKEKGFLLPKSQEEAYQQVQDTISSIKGETYAPRAFTRIAMEISFGSFFITALKTLGFEFRTEDFKTTTVEDFLRNRMAFFDIDLPHDPLFGEPPGTWPKS